jgi:hypothetical protein
MRWYRVAKKGPLFNVADKQNARRHRKRFSSPDGGMSDFADVAPIYSAGFWTIKFLAESGPH